VPQSGPVDAPGAAPLAAAGTTGEPRDGSVDAAAGAAAVARMGLPHSEQ
jgi:hypothetical protein